MLFSCRSLFHPLHIQVELSFNHNHYYILIFWKAVTNIMLPLWEFIITIMFVLFGNTFPRHGILIFQDILELVCCKRRDKITSVIIIQMFLLLVFIIWFTHNQCYVVIRFHHQCRNHTDQILQCSKLRYPTCMGNWMFWLYEPTSSMR